MEIVDNAIEESKRRDQTVRVDQIDADRAHVSLDAVCQHLASACVGSAELAPTEREFWGVDSHGAHWCVRVVR